MPEVLPSTLTIVCPDGFRTRSLGLELPMAASMRTVIRSPASTSRVQSSASAEPTPAKALVTEAVKKLLAAGVSENCSGATCWAEAVRPRPKANGSRLKDSRRSTEPANGVHRSRRVELGVVIGKREGLRIKAKD